MGFLGTGLAKERLANHRLRQSPSVSLEAFVYVDHMRFDDPHIDQRSDMSFGFAVAYK
jgi:hypothetical protein